MCGFAEDIGDDLLANGRRQTTIGERRAELLVALDRLVELEQLVLNRGVGAFCRSYGIKGVCIRVDLLCAHLSPLCLRTEAGSDLGNELID